MATLGTFPRLAICFGLVVSILAIYGQTAWFDFVNFDDDLYVFGNSHVLAGLTPDSIKWALTAIVSSNWMPVTLLSYMLDVQLFGSHSGTYHLVNVVFHAISAALLFVVLHRATREPRASAFVAFVFAVHPLHVESVAWISERKDVLSTFFWFLTLYFYLRYSERPGVARYLQVVAFFSLGLMSKPMLVTLPFTLLLFDMWPLRRTRWPRILWEKLPLFALSAYVSIVTWRAQGPTPGPLSQRIGNALDSYLVYIGQMFRPAQLAVFYPSAGSIPVSHTCFALTVLLGITGLAMWVSRTRPWFAMGWLWYLGTLVPVIGLVQVGDQAHADRYTYIPLIGLSIILAWGAVDIAGRWPQTTPVFAVAAAVSLGACIMLAWNQTSYWRNGETLFRHAIDSTRANWMAEGNLGGYLMSISGRRAEAREHLETALRMKPDSANAHNNLGVYLAQSGQCGDAIPHFEAVLRTAPDSAEASNNLGWCLNHTGRVLEAIPRFEAAIRLRPDYAEAYFNLGLVLSKIPGRSLDAVARYEDAVRIQPEYAEAQLNLGFLLLHVGLAEEAIPHLEVAQRLHPDSRIAQILSGLRAPPM